MDDHEVVRAGLRSVLSHRADLAVVDEAATGGEAVEKAVRLRPDIVIMDLRLPEGDGVEAIRLIVKKCPAIRILVLTAFADDQLLFDAIRAGAHGYILKEINSEKLIEALRALARGEALVDPRVTERILKRFKEGPLLLQQDTAFSGLSFQERRILAFIADGKTNREIGQRLHLSEKTIRNYTTCSSTNAFRAVAAERNRHQHRDSGS